MQRYNLSAAYGDVLDKEYNAETLKGKDLELDHLTRLKQNLIDEHNFITKQFERQISLLKLRFKMEIHSSQTDYELSQFQFRNKVEEILYKFKVKGFMVPGHLVDYINSFVTHGSINNGSLNSTNFFTHNKSHQLVEILNIDKLLMDTSAAEQHSNFEGINLAQKELSSNNLKEFKDRITENVSAIDSLNIKITNNTELINALSTSMLNIASEFNIVNIDQVNKNNSAVFYGGAQQGIGPIEHYDNRHNDNSMYDNRRTSITQILNPVELLSNIDKRPSNALGRATLNHTSVPPTLISVLTPTDSSTYQFRHNNNIHSASIDHSTEMRSKTIDIEVPKLGKSSTSKSTKIPLSKILLSSSTPPTENQPDNNNDSSSVTSRPRSMLQINAMLNFDSDTAGDSSTPLENVMALSKGIDGPVSNCSNNNNPENSGMSSLAIGSSHALFGAPHGENGNYSNTPTPPTSSSISALTSNNINGNKKLTKDDDRLSTSDYLISRSTSSAAKTSDSSSISSASTNIPSKASIGSEAVNKSTASNNDYYDDDDDDDDDDANNEESDEGQGYDTNYDKSDSSSPQKERNNKLKLQKNRELEEIQAIIPKNLKKKSRKDPTKYNSTNILNKDSTNLRTCPICERKFYRAEHLKRHLTSVHNKEKPFTCEFCRKNFTRKDNLNQHQKRKHVEEFDRLNSEQNQNQNQRT